MLQMSEWKHWVLKSFILKSKNWWERVGQNISSSSVVHCACWFVLLKQWLSSFDVPQNQLKDLLKHRTLCFIPRDSDPVDLNVSSFPNYTHAAVLGNTHSELLHWIKPWFVVRKLSLKKIIDMELFIFNF